MPPASSHASRPRRRFARHPAGRDRAHQAQLPRRPRRLPARHDVAVDQMVREVVQQEGGKPIASVWGSGVKADLADQRRAGQRHRRACVRDGRHPQGVDRSSQLARGAGRAGAGRGRPVAERPGHRHRAGARLRDRPAHRQCRDHGAVPQRLPSAGHDRRVRRRRDRRPAAAARRRADAARARHRRLDGRRPDGGAGRRDGEAPARRPRGAERHDGGAAREEAASPASPTWSRRATAAS